MANAPTPNPRMDPVTGLPMRRQRNIERPGETGNRDGTPSTSGSPKEGTGKPGAGTF